MKGLTKRQEEILEYITECIDRQGYPPSIPEVQERFSFRSPTAVNDHFKALERKGYIERHKGKSRSISVKGRISEIFAGNIINLPILGRVAAGVPLLAEENIEGTMALDSSLAGQGSKAFILRVKGNSMENAGIINGDYIVVRPDMAVENGEIAVVLFDNEATVKRIYKEQDRLKLVPENDSMAPFYADPKKGEISIVGKVKAVIRKIN